MASELKVDKFTGVTTAGSILVTGEGNSTTTSLQQGLTKTWAEFTIAATFVNLDSFNVASLTDNGAGDCNVNHTNNMATTNYAGSASRDNGSSNYDRAIVQNTTTGYVRIMSFSGGNTPTDSSNVHGIVCGDLA